MMCEGKTLVIMLHYHKYLKIFAGNILVKLWVENTYSIVKIPSTKIPILVLVAVILIILVVEPIQASVAVPILDIPMSSLISSSNQTVPIRDVMLR